MAPAGLRIKEAPTVDLFRIPGEKIPEMLVYDFEVIKPHLPAGMDVDFAVERFREITTVARSPGSGCTIPSCRAGCIA